MDNNYAEQTIRPFTTGRKNFVMIESSNGAKASVMLYSPVETAKANMINTFEHFNLLLTVISQHMDNKELRFIDNLLPRSPKVQKKCPTVLMFENLRIFYILFFYSSTVPTWDRKQY